jgi:pimeloyl-ACP methyl ester carboxylesterase/AraC-like DNA-binding protein
MTALPDNLTETPDRSGDEALNVDVLDDILSSLRLTGGVVVDGEFTGEFCVLAQFTPNHFAPFFPEPETMITYHYVRSGQMLIEVEGQPPVVIDAGTVAILPRNDAHMLASRSGLPPADASDVHWVTSEGVHHVAVGTDGPKSEIWCGFLGAAKSSAHPLLDALPPLLTLDVTGGEAQWLESSMRFLAEQNPPADMVAKLAELFLSQAIRDYVGNLPPSSKGWLKGLADPAVSKALSVIHTRYNEELDIEGLAREAGVSRTVLGERFAELIGEPPMRYCAHWRMRVAANMLRDGKQNTANVAYAVGFNSEAAFNRAFKREYGEPPATWRRKIEADEQARSRVTMGELPPQQVRYCIASDGTQLAYSVMGEGPPLVKTANWLNHIEYDWESPLWKHWLSEFTRGRSLIRYDERGNGLSDWDTPELSFEAFVDDLECVADCLHLEQFDLFAISQGAAVAVAYAVRHPERVRHLVILNGYAAGWAVRSDPAEVARREAMLTLTQLGWGADNPAYRQLFTNTYVPGASPKQMGWFNEMQRRSASPENAVRLQRVLSKIDVRELLPQVRTPTLIFHSREDQAVPFEQGEELAAGIPGARFVPLESRNHILTETEAAWPMFAEISREFLDHDADMLPAVPMPRSPAKPTETMGECEGPDGARIAYAVAGEGFPIVKAPNWMTHLDHDWTSPVYGHWYRECERTNRLVRFDMRGFGKSEWEPPEFDFETMVGDLAAVIDAAEVERCDLLGISHGAAFAIAYAARYPERVRRLVLVNSFAAGWRVRADPEEVAWRESLLEMNRRQPSFRRSLLGEMFITLYFPSADQALIDWHNELFSTLGPVPNMQKIIEVAAWIDVREELAKVKAPTLVFHADKDGNAPMAVGRQVAAGIPNARFVELESANHVLLADEPAWPVFTRELRALLAADELAEAS